MRCPTCKEDVLVIDGRCTQCNTVLDGDVAKQKVVAAQIGDDDETLIFQPDDDSDKTLLMPGSEVEDPDATLLMPGSEEEDPDATLIYPIERDDSGTVIVSDPGQDQTVVDDQPKPARPKRQDDGPLELGREFGKRYHIIKLLGLGGMGAVYQAWDVVLGIVVALKVVRPEVGADPKMAEELDQRFKRELLLAREVTHKNVVRIHDLGEIDGIKYITMTFIDGEDLSSVLKREGKLSVPHALQVFRSVLSGILAAHEAGVVHRDLKPANIMIGTEDQEAHLMDFGVARSSSEGAEKPAIEGVPIEKLKIPELGQTMAGAVVGTLEYMAPEQFRGKIADQRSDLYTLGLILYDLLHGSKRAKSGKSAIKELMQRSEEPPPPIRSLEPEVPEPLDKIITRCLQPNPDDRYQTTWELAEDLDLLDEEGELKPVRRQITWRMITAASAGVVALLAGTFWLASSRAPETEPEPMSILIADIDNQTGDPTFNGAVEQALSIAMEGAGFISSYPRPSAQKVAEQLLPGSDLDPSLAKLVSRREGIDVVITASVTEKGSGYRITAQALDTGLEAEEGKPLARASESAKSKEAVLPAVGRLAADLRKRLGDTAPESARLAASETFTAASLEAMSAYASAQDSLYQGDFDQALEQYQQAVTYDSEFGRAYSGMAVVYANQKQYDKAEESYQEALKQLDRMTERERYRTLGSYYLDISRNNEKAIENYETLVDLYPADRAGHANLALAYLYSRDFERAVQEGSRSIELEPNNLLQRTNYSMYLMYAGDFEQSMVQANKVLEANPKYGYARFTLARSAVGAGKLDTGREAYRELRKLGGFNADLADMGEADLEMFAGRYGPAASLLESALESDSEGRSIAAHSQVLAEAYLALGRLDDARELAQKAAEVGTHESVLYPAARVLAAAGDVTSAEAIALDLENRLQSQTVSYARLIEGEIALSNNRLLPAVESIKDGWERNDSWLAHLLLGRAYLEAEHFPEALGEFQLCIERQGEILDVFLVDGSTIRYLPEAYYYLGRAQEGIGDGEAARASYQRYLELRSATDTPDPLAADASARWSSLQVAEAS